MGHQQNLGTIYRGKIYHAYSPNDGAFYTDGALSVTPEGRIAFCGHWDDFEKSDGFTDDAPVHLADHQLIIPGLVDMHLHLPQISETGLQKESLLEWLDHHIFPAESAFADESHAREVSDWFFTELLRNGTTTAAVFLTLHKEATDIAFEVAAEKGNRAIMGLNLMDKNAPEFLCKPTAQMLAETEVLCNKWHGYDDGRLLYAWMPRFAITSTDELLEGLGRLRTQYPDVYFHSHLSEQKSEIQVVLEQFPNNKDYTDVYECHGLIAEPAILAHSIHLSDDEMNRIKSAGAGIAHCPTSNFFLKSGRFRWFDVVAQGLRLGLASDVGAGPEMSLFKVMKDTQFMQKDELISCHTLFYYSTQGSAEALRLQDKIGNFEAGKDADFLILNFQNKSNIPEKSLLSVEDILSTLVYLGDERLVQETYIRGKQVYKQETSQSVQCV